MGESILHTIVAVDLDGDGRDEIVAGQRAGTRSVYIYQANGDSTDWSRMTLDDDGMAAARLRDRGFQPGEVCPFTRESRSLPAS